MQVDTKRVLMGRPSKASEALIFPVAGKQGEPLEPLSRLDFVLCMCLTMACMPWGTRGSQGTTFKQALVLSFHHAVPGMGLKSSGLV